MSCYITDCNKCKRSFESGLPKCKSTYICEICKDEELILKKGIKKNISQNTKINYICINENDKVKHKKKFINYEMVQTMVNIIEINDLTLYKAKDMGSIFRYKPTDYKSYINIINNNNKYKISNLKLNNIIYKSVPIYINKMGAKELCDNIKVYSISVIGTLRLLDKKCLFRDLMGEIENENSLPHLYSNMNKFKI